MTYTKTFIFFKTTSNTYVFDDTTGLIIQIPPKLVALEKIFREACDPTELYNKLSEVEKSEHSYGHYIEMLKVLISNYGAFFRDPDAIEIEPPNEDLVRKEIAKAGFYELILNVTERCNLRCRYCVYSGIYENQRLHSSKDMNIRTAKKAVDLYFTYIKEGAKYNPLRYPVIGFYGGEPLLNFDLIRKIVNYIEDTYADYNVLYTITTNGTLLNEEIIKLIIEKGFGIFISLDGSPQEHNRNRVFADGSGSFDIVYDNIRKIKTVAPHCILFALAVYDAYTDLQAVKKFFDDPEIAKLIRLMRIDKVREYFIKPNHIELIHTSEHQMSQLAELREKFLEEYVRNSKFGSSPFYDALFGMPTVLTFYRPLIFRTKSRLIPYTGSCIPGFKIFVNTDGSLLTCERVGDYIVIGDVNDGLNYKAISNLVAEFQETILSKCRYCNIAFSCPLCHEAFYNRRYEFNASLCTNARKRLRELLTFTMSIYEKNPAYFSSFTDSDIPRPYIHRFI